MARILRTVQWHLKLTLKASTQSQKTGTTLLRRLRKLLTKISKMVGLSTADDLGRKETQLTSRQEDSLPERSNRITIPGTQVINHRQMTRSISHSQYQRWKQSIDANNAEHDRAMATEPLNPISQATGRPRHMYETYQVKIPTFTLVNHLEDSNAAEQNRMKSKTWEGIAKLRLQKQVGLREWEWCAGEPEENPQTASDEEHGDLVRATEEIQISKPEISATVQSQEQAVTEASKPLTYAERTKTFAYTRGEDPMWKGRHFYLKRGNNRHIFYTQGDFSNEVSEEDRKFVPKIESNVDLDKEPRQFRCVQDNTEQESQMAHTATEYLFGGVSRVDERQMEAEAQVSPPVPDQGETRTAMDGEAEAHDLKTPPKIEVHGQGTQRFARLRQSSASGCSVMTEFSDDV